jgi:hypothetical protein
LHEVCLVNAATKLAAALCPEEYEAAHHAQLANVATDTKTLETKVNE